MPRKGSKSPKAKAPKAARKRGAAAARPRRGTTREDRGKRLLDLVVLLLGARTPVSFREIRQQFKAYRTAQDEAGLRAFERDKADLLELGVPLRYVIPEEDESIEEGGYIVDLRRYRLPEVHFTPDEIAALALAQPFSDAASGTTYGEVVDLALKKLRFDLPEALDSPGAPGAPGTPRKQEPVLIHFPRPAGTAELSERLGEIEHAVVNRKQITFRYTSAKRGETKTRTVDPYGLVYREQSWVLVGRCHEKGMRSFRLDRMQGLATAPKPKSPDFDRPADFDVRRYALRSPWTFEEETPVDVVLEVRHDAASVANEDFGESAAREPLSDGGVRVRFRCANPDYVVTRVLKAKGAIVVRSPESVRVRVREELARVAARYKAEPKARDGAEPKARDGI